MGTDYLMMNGMNIIRAVMISLVKNIKELIIKYKILIILALVFVIILIFLAINTKRQIKLGTQNQGITSEMVSEDINGV